MGTSTLLILAAAAGFSAAPQPARPASANATATVRILTPALVGGKLAPPREGMTARETEIVQRDGSTLSLRLYEFE